MSDPTNDGLEGLRPAAPVLLVTLVAEALITAVDPNEARTLEISLLAHASRAPQVAGLAPCRACGRPVLPRQIRDVFCGWRVTPRDQGDPTVGWCAGCSCGVAIGAEGATS